MLNIMHTTQALACMSSELYKVLQYFRMAIWLVTLEPFTCDEHHVCLHVCSADFRRVSWMSSVVHLSFMLSHLVPSIKPCHEKVCQIAILNALRTTFKSVARCLRFWWRCLLSCHRRRLRLFCIQPERQW